MSRAEELRKKFAQKGRDAIGQSESDQGDFLVRLNEILAAEKNAKATSSAFVDNLHAKFGAEAPADADAWIKDNIAGLFVSAARKPEWVYEESWCFDDNGSPLEFLHQFEDEDGVNFYIFRGYKEGVVHNVRGKVRFLKIAAQDQNGIIHLDGDVVG